MDRVRVFFNSTLPHFSQMITGLEYLRDHNKIELRHKFELHHYPVRILRIDYKGLGFFFDMSDNSGIDLNIYEEGDFYFKRMLNNTDFEQYDKLVPYGSNYQV